MGFYSTSSEFKVVLYRKLLHVLLCLGLYVPYLPYIPLLGSLGDYGVSKEMYYAVLALVAAAINAIIVKKPLIRVELKEKLQERRRKLVEELLKLAPSNRIPAVAAVAEFEEKLKKLEDSFEEHISRIERSYERIGGYLGITHGVVGVLVSHVVFGGYALYGIYALTVVDPVAAVAGSLAGAHRVPYSSGTFEGALASLMAFALFLCLLGIDAPRALLISAAASIAELYGVEDNLSIPIAASAVAYFLHA